MAPNQQSVETGVNSWRFLTGGHSVESIYEEFDGYGLNCESKRRKIIANQNMTNEGIDSVKAAEHVPVDVLEVSRNRDVKVVAKDDPDATENSSSFADTASGNEDSNGLSNAEVESQFFGENDLAPPFYRLSNVFPMRKKKLTTHWRNFIHPLMWRCKWTEIKIKQLESQSSKYARYISAYDRKKHMASDQVIEQSGSRSVPFTCQGQRKQPMKRIKRKRKEDTTDVALYMSNHNLFSQRENKRLDLDGVPAWEELGSSEQNTAGHDDFGLNDDCLFPEDSNDNFQELVLRKIESVHTRVHKLKFQLDSVMINNAAKFSSSENLSENLACEVQQTSSIRSPTLSACNGDMGGLQHMLDYDLADFILPDSAVSSFGEAVPVPDIIESTVGLLTVDATQHQAQIGDSSERIVDNILLHNDAAEVEGSTCKSNRNPSAEKTDDAEISGEEESNNATINLASQEHSTLKSCLASEIHFPKNKRKRGERKAGSGNWSRQRPGEPDS